MTPLARQISYYLPNLRRYAIALTGSRSSGDAYIRAALEILLEEPTRVRPEGDLKFQLYGLIRDVMGIFGPGWFDQAADEGELYDDICRKPLATSLIELPLLTRQLFLLVTLEGFSLERAAELMDVTQSEAQIHVAWAREQLNDAHQGHGKTYRRHNNHEQFTSLPAAMPVAISSRGGRFQINRHH